jgi:hypothetical protein
MIDYETTRDKLVPLKYRTPEEFAMMQMRKFYSWYFKGVAVTAEIRKALQLVTAVKQQDALLDKILQLGGDLKDAEVEELRRGRTGGVSKIFLPAAWLDSRD